MLAINSKLLQAHFFLIKLDKWKLILLAVLINLLNSFFYSFISNIFFETKLSKGFRPFGSLTEEIILAILVAPLFETFIFQYGVFETFKKKYNSFTCCLISAFLFGLLHLYNGFYFLFAFFAGLLLAYVYYIGSLTKKGILITLLVHFIYNALAVILKNI
jgi:membrane protease YdiL (CAAX protease family)